jgi:dTDP-4-dehydrorhamnose reductase
MKKIAILGASGMLGSMVKKYFSSVAEEREYIVVGSVKDPQFLQKGDFIFDPLDMKSWGNIPQAAYYINCIGIVKPAMARSIKASIIINAYYPHLLADSHQNVIHITTDCVFSGREGNYDENSPHDALDDYGKSKSLGEPKNCMVLRTSIIGPEVHNHYSLLAWVLQQGGKEINGFTNHDWNGITTLQFAKVCDQIIKNNLYKEEMYHIHSPSKVNKFELVSMINYNYSVGAEIHPIAASVKIDRTLSTVKDLCGKLNIPEIRDQICEL